MSDNLGFMVLVNMLYGNEESAKAFQSVIGKKIISLSLGEDDALHFVFEDESRFKLFDDGQSCCESRYMRTDDDLSLFIGANFLGAEIRDTTDVEDDGDVHEIQFLIINTNKGSFTMANHNEHNGYYGGFSLKAEMEESK
jgi:hypothetical protein